MKVPFTVTKHTISVYMDGNVYHLSEQDRPFEMLREELRKTEHDVSEIRRLVALKNLIIEWSGGAVTIAGDNVYFNGKEITGTISERMLEMFREGFDVTPFSRFVERIQQNPSERSRNCLLDFLEHWRAPITHDGRFMAFKRVRRDFFDIHSGKFDNSPGRVVSIDRSEVDPNPHETCSHGLHVAASKYLDDFHSGKDYKTVACLVCPSDVVAVPGDYKFAKMRVCRYEVASEVADNWHHTADKHLVVNPDEPGPIRLGGVLAGWIERILK